MVHPNGRSRSEVPPSEHQHDRSRHTGSKTNGLAGGEMGESIGKGRDHSAILSTRTGTLPHASVTKPAWLRTLHRTSGRCPPGSTDRLSEHDGGFTV